MNNRQELYTITWRQEYTDWYNELADPVELMLLDSNYTEARAVIEQVKNLK